MSSTRTSPTRQPVGAMMLKRITSVTVKAAWPAANEIAAGAKPATRIANGSSTHSTVELVPISSIRPAPTMKPASVPSSPRRAFWPMLSAFERSTDKRREHHPERVLHLGQVGTQHRQAEGDGAAQAVVQPDRVPVDVGVGPLLRRGERAGDARRLAAEEAGPASRGGSAATASSMLVAIWEAA